MPPSSSFIPHNQRRKKNYFQVSYTILEYFPPRNCGIHFADAASSCEFLHPQQQGITFHAQVSTLNFAPTLRAEQELTRKQTYSLLMSFKPKYFCPKISSKLLTACEPVEFFMIRTTKGESKICLHKANTATLPGKRSLHGHLQVLQLLTSATLFSRHTLKGGTRVAIHSGDLHLGCLEGTSTGFKLPSSH